VLSLFVGEAVALSVAGGVLGVMVAAGLIRLIGKSASTLGVPGGLRVTLSTMVVAVMVAALVGLVSGCLPAYNASRINIVEGLRHIG
jgi:putative ABC transport system permease protein